MKEETLQSRMLSELNLIEVYRGLFTDNRDFFNNIERPDEDMDEDLEKEILEVEEKVNSIIDGPMREIINKLENDVLDNSESIRICLLFSSQLMRITALTMNLKIKLNYLENGVPESEWEFIEGFSSLTVECIVCHKEVPNQPDSYWRGKKGIYCNGCWNDLELQREERRPEMFSDNFELEYEEYEVWELEHFEQ